MNDEVEEVEGAQPTGERLETTMDVCTAVLFDAEIAEQVRVQNGFPEGMTQDRIAFMFLLGRFQQAVTTLAQRTDTLARVLDGRQRDESILDD